MQTLWGWDDERTAQAVRDYEMELHRTFVVFERGAGRPAPVVDEPQRFESESGG